MPTESLPTWDLTPYFTSPTSPEYVAERGDLARILAELETTQFRDPEDFDKFNHLVDRLETLFAYTSCLVTTDTRDDDARAAESELDAIISRARKLRKTLTRKIGAGEPISPQWEAAHRFFVAQSRVSATHLMPPDLESLASDLEVTGSTAWAKLYASVTSQIEVRVGDDLVPISSARALASDPVREVRQAAYEAELGAWKAHEVPLAAAMNSIKGEWLTLLNRRNWSDPIEEACFRSNMDRPTLDAMLAAATEAFPVFRRYLKAKAKALGLAQLAWFDLFAPLSSAAEPWPWAKSTHFVAEQFDQYSATLGAFARRSYAEAWIDAEPRPGKVDGAYCAPMRDDESRILMNFKPSFDAVRTLAHELGHGYHCVCLNGKTALQRETPNTLAETASIFCETIIVNAAAEAGSADQKLAVLEASLQGSTQIVVDIFSRFLFERSVFERRRQRELSARELCDLMREAQDATYGNGLDADLRHPYMWAAKPHYYGESFYNFPYMFGLLFAKGLYTVYLQEGAAFRDRYDQLLASTGQDDAATLADRFGINIRSIDFWRGSLAGIERDVERFESLIG